jgi:alpha-beta hydrolase superfamily lysophospholipase/SAM-dependent methyltransferase
MHQLNESDWGTTTLAAGPLEVSARTSQTRAMKSWDGAELFYRAWPGAAGSTRSLVLFHRGHEHSGRYQELVDRLGLDDFHIFAWDARGHGRSPGERGYADNFGCVVRDIDAFIRHISSENGLRLEDMSVLGHSVGGVAVAAWVHDYAPPIRVMILVTPAFRVKLYVPFALPALQLRMLVQKKSFIKSYVKPGMLTHDAAQAALYAEDPLISRNIATNILINLHDTATRLLKDAAAIRTPLLLLSAGSDWVVKNSAQQTFFNRVGSTTKRTETYSGFYHALLHEQHRARPIAAIREFITTAFDKIPETVSLRDAHLRGYTKDEYDRLQKPLPFLSPGRLNFAVQKIVLGTICRLSDGFRLGWKTGFDSGESLDYVYRNQPRGFTPLGKMIDWLYLNSPGWTGVRVRKAQLQQTLRETIGKVSGSAGPARIVDIAAGGARYLLEVMQEMSGRDVTAVLRDRSPAALDVARRTAGEMKLSNVSFADGDAFDFQSLATMEPRPNIAIVSGLYELFGDNEMIMNSLRGLAEALRPNGFLIYTNQPWHPQLEMIARVLINRDHQPWVMRRRTQAEMDELVRTAGFEKIGMTIDPSGIFTVSVARRVGP